MTADYALRQELHSTEDRLVASMRIFFAGISFVFRAISKPDPAANSWNIVGFEVGDRAH